MEEGFEQGLLESSLLDMLDFPLDDPPGTPSQERGPATQLSADADAPRRTWRTREMRVAALQMLKTHTYRAVAKHFGVASHTLYLWKRQFVRERTLAPRGVRGRPRALSGSQADAIAARLRENPTASNARGHAHFLQTDAATRAWRLDAAIYLWLLRTSVPVFFHDEALLLQTHRIEVAGNTDATAFHLAKDRVFELLGTV